jgi:hypothetical protein
MVAGELITCHVPKDLTSPTPMVGYVVSFVAFYVQGFDVPLH